MKRIIIAVASLVLLSAQKSYWAAGNGTESCATAFPSEGIEARISGEWVLGYMSGRNDARSAFVGKATDSLGIVGEVKLFCQNHPSESLAHAAAATYDMLEQKNRNNNQ
jgi:hypothetical protein